MQTPNTRMMLNTNDDGIYGIIFLKYKIHLLFIIFMLYVKIKYDKRMCIDKNKEV